MIRRINYAGTLAYCDGVQIFEARDDIGGHYVALLATAIDLIHLRRATELRRGFWIWCHCEPDARHEEQRRLDLYFFVSLTSTPTDRCTRLSDIGRLPHHHRLPVHQRDTAVPRLREAFPQKALRSVLKS